MPSNDINSIQFDVEEIRDANGFVAAVVIHSPTGSHSPDPHGIAREIGLDPQRPSSEPPEALNGLSYRFVPKDEEPVEQLAWNKERKITMDL
jgi:hypothetical protein